MKIVLYEWCCSGGLAAEPAPADHASLAAEGRMMLEALAADAARDPAIDVTVLVDATRAMQVPAAARTLSVESGAEIAALVAAACDADWTVIVAPESDGILAARVAAARSAGARVLAPPDAFIAIASDKQRTIDALAAAGVPVPAGRSLAAGEPVPVGFHLPAVRKSRDGAGGDGLEIIRRHDVAAATQAMRLEAYAPGMPVGVSCLCGPAGIDVLPPMRQRFSAGDCLRYQGSDLLVDEALVSRAESLARRAVVAVTRAAAAESRPRGWVGVDMILGQRDDGGDDRVLEVNPRLTTSFVWLAPRAASSIVRSLIDRASSELS